MNKLLKYSFYLLAFLLVPWVFIYVGLILANLFLGTGAEDIVSSLESLRNWDGVLVIGLIVSASLIFYWQDLVVWFAKNHTKTNWSESNIRKVAKQSHVIVTFVAIVHIAFILWQ